MQTHPGRKLHMMYQTVKSHLTGAAICSEEVIFAVSKSSKTNKTCNSTRLPSICSYGLNRETINVTYSVKRVTIVPFIEDVYNLTGINSDSKVLLEMFINTMSNRLNLKFMLNIISFYT